MEQQPKNQADKEKVQPILSLRARDGAMLETLLKPESGETFLLCQVGKQLTEHRSIVVEQLRYVPYSPKNNLLSHRVILLPSNADPYTSIEHLTNDVRAFIHKYVDLDPSFEEVAAHYVLMTWGYDVFNALPYLRVRGDYGSGKSRFLLTIGSLCYKPIFASGASTVSPLFRLIDQVGGTLIVDEADFWASDERSEIIKILNNGNARGFPVLRSEITPTKEFNPRAFDIYGPKIIATRHEFQDEALESRCLTQELSGRRLRDDIPISLPRNFNAEAQALRNQLLKYRFERFSSLDEPTLDAEPGLSPRRAQILAPLLRVAVSDDARRRILAFATGGAEDEPSSQAESERSLLTTIQALLVTTPASISLAGLAKKFTEDWQGKYRVEVSPRWVGTVLRRLSVELQKSNGVYVIPSTSYPHLTRLIDERLRDLGDERDVAPGCGPDNEEGRGQRAG